jgi:hypothetical protein
MALPFTGCQQHHLRRAKSGCPTCAFIAELEARLEAACCAGCGLVLPSRAAAAEHVAGCAKHPVGKRVLAAERSAAEAREALHGLLLHQGVCCTDRDDNPIPCRFWDAAAHAIEGRGYDMTRFAPAFTERTPPPSAPAADGAKEDR